MNSIEKELHELSPIEASHVAGGNPLANGIAWMEQRAPLLMIQPAGIIKERGVYIADPDWGAGVDRAEI